MPARPWISIGRKMPFMKTKLGQKWSLPKKSFILRPVALGYQ
jgi:hypothetical protein